jgi:hypothetical protein
VGGPCITYESPTDSESFKTARNPLDKQHVGSGKNKDVQVLSKPDRSRHREIKPDSNDAEGDEPLTDELINRKAQATFDEYRIIQFVEK